MYANAQIGLAPRYDFRLHAFEFRIREIKIADSLFYIAVKCDTMKKLIFLLQACFAFTFCAWGQKTYLYCGRLIDGSSNTVRKAVTIVVDGKRIVQIKSGYLKADPDDRVIDLKNRTVLPGFIDCHVHLEFQQSKSSFSDGFRNNEADVAFLSATYAKATLMAGFTTVRDLGGSGVNVSLRNAINKGVAIGPNILTAGKAISASGGHMDESVGLREGAYRHTPGPEDGVADGTDEAVKAVRYRFKEGADLIKIASTGGVLDLSKDGTGAQFSIKEIQAIVSTAQDYGMPVACHAHGAEGIRRAILGGVNSIEHGTFMNNECMELARKHGVWLVPTLTAGRAVADSAKIPGFFPQVVAGKAAMVGPQIQKTFAKAFKAGVKIAFGTDAGVYPHGKNYLEFGYMTEAGMPVMEAIKAATANAAELLGISKDRGGITIGKIADIIALDGDPLRDMAAFGRVIFVMKEGTVYKGQ
jgi:imidazolonepropionase-like amidohydrolase